MEETLKAVGASGYADLPKQIPATVIDNGILAFIPYSSFRIGADRELNIYGDPADPACVEFGVYHSLLNSDAEKRRCIAFLQQLVPGIDLGEIALARGKMLRSGLVAEITPPTDPDAYGGWWISLYSLKKLHEARGTRENVTIVSVPKDTAALGDSGWSSEDIRYSRASSTESSYSGRVYVRGYTRKDGTYVDSYTRSAPHRR
jgi:hypothetical protein